MINFGPHTRVFLAAGVTDMRKAIDGLSVLVVDVLEEDPLSSHLFVFCNRLKDKIKILYWHNNGFWLFYRRLERAAYPRGKSNNSGGQVAVISMPLRSVIVSWTGYWKVWILRV